jgi:hypothetical protein
MVYTVRFAGGRGGRNAFEQELHDRHVVQKNSRPGHPTTSGKAERFQQTMKNWLAAQPVQPDTIADLQTLLDVFAVIYNHQRPHRSLPHRATPATLYDTMPKAFPARSPTQSPTTGSDTTPSTKPGRSPCATAADCTTSASAEPTQEPATNPSRSASARLGSTRSLALGGAEGYSRRSLAPMAGERHFGCWSSGVRVCRCASPVTGGRSKSTFDIRKRATLTPANPAAATNRPIP